jgi:hypothetical protein
MENEDNNQMNMAASPRESCHYPEVEEEVEEATGSGRGKSAENHPDIHSKLQCMSSSNSKVKECQEPLEPVEHIDDLPVSKKFPVKILRMECVSERVSEITGSSLQKNLELLKILGTESLSTSEQEME